MLSLKVKLQLKLRASRFDPCDFSLFRSMFGLLAVVSLNSFRDYVILPQKSKELRLMLIKIKKKEKVKKIRKIPIIKAYGTSRPDRLWEVYG